MGAHLDHRGAVFLLLGELRAQQIPQFGIAGILGDGGANLMQIWRVHGPVAYPRK